MKRVIVDASVAIKWFMAEDDSAAAHNFLSTRLEFWAPDLLRLEIASGMWKNWRKKLASAEQVRSAIAALDRTIAVWQESSRLIDHAVDLSLALDHGIYDCIYLSLAQATAIPVVTADKRMLAVAPNGLAVALTDWSP